MGIIFWWSTLSVLPGPTNRSLVWWDFVIKKMAHMTEYGLLFFSFQRALNWGKDFEARDYRLTFVWVIFYAITDEFHQLFTPSRHAKVTDVGFDVIGGFLVYLKLKGFV